MDIQLNATEARVLGCLLEKERTTPDAYPLTLNALQMACNQKTSRDPVMALTTSQIEAALDSLRYEKHLVFQVSQAGSRVPKYKHNLEKVGNFSDADIAILTVLMLRGPQTASEVKAHCDRMHHFASREAAEEALESLRTSDAGPFVQLLPREPGRRERRYVEQLSEADAAPAPETETEDAEIVPRADSAPSLTERVAQLETDVAGLRSALETLSAELGVELMPAPPPSPPSDDAVNIPAAHGTKEPE